MLKKFILSVFLFNLSVSLLFASGFSIYEQGTRATGMAGAFIARANNASALFYNPAGITNLKGINFSAGITGITTQFSFTGPNIFDPQKYTKANKGSFYPFHLYGSYSISEELNAGLAIFSPFGLSTSWGGKNKPWVGRQFATNSKIQTLFINPNLAYRISENLSVAAGFSFVLGKVKMEKSVFFIPRNVFGESALEAQTSGFGFNFGLQYEPFHSLHLGFIYRSNVLLKFKNGDATFTFPDLGNDTLNQEITTYFPAKTKGSADLKLPDMAGIGIAYDFTPNLSMEFDFVHLGWHSYDRLTVHFQDAVAGKMQTEDIRNYTDSYSLRFGFEYWVIPSFTIRAGYSWEKHTVPGAYVEPSLPDGNRNNYTFGAGYRWQNMTIDIAYQSLLQDDRSISNSANDFNGKYTGLANLYGLTLGYAF